MEAREGAHMRGLLRSMPRGAVVFGRKPVTIHYPDEKRRLPARARTFPYLIWNHQLDEPNCTGCGKCATGSCRPSTDD